MSENLIDEINASNSVWLFGYGSLCWEQNFTFSQRQNGYIKGWKRRFYKISTAAWGSPSNPGRVSTVSADDAGGKVFGCAFELTENRHIKVAFEYISKREGDYTLTKDQFYCQDTGKSITVYF